MTELWRPGDTVILRNTGLMQGEVMGTPHIVIEDTESQTVLFRPEGTIWAMWLLDEQRFKDVSPTRMDMLRFMFPGRGYAIELYFNTGRGPPYRIFAGEGRFRGWKINIEAPFTRTSIGFDTTDRQLDIFVQPDRTWYWADEKDLAFWVEKGGYTPEESEAFYSDAREAERLIKAGLPPFDDSCLDWHPPQDFAPRVLPDGWQFFEGAEITAGIGRRYDAWRTGVDIAGVIEDWDQLLDDRSPEARRSGGTMNT